MIQQRAPGHVERVGLLGGTFDPVHLGHLLVAQTALEELNLDRIIFLPAAVSPLKTNQPPLVSATDRLAMLWLALEGEARFSADDRELRRNGPSYAIDTVHSLLNDYPGVRFLYLIGADQMHLLPRWHRIEELRNLVDFAVFDRSSDVGSFALGKEWGFEFVHRRIDISSTEIRERLAKGLSVRYILTPTVRNYIMTHQLYLPPSPSRASSADDQA
jgi:nicotinate-nucleotide adenylyltransferase